MVQKIKQKPIICFGPSHVTGRTILSQTILFKHYDSCDWEQPENPSSRSMLLMSPWCYREAPIHTQLGWAFVVLTLWPSFLPSLTAIQPVHPSDSQSTCPPPTQPFNLPTPHTANHHPPILPTTPVTTQASAIRLPKSVFSGTFQLVFRKDALFALGLFRELLWDPLSSHELSGGGGSARTPGSLFESWIQNSSNNLDSQTHEAINSHFCLS